MKLTYTTVRNLVWRNAEHTIFDCFVFFEHIGQEVPFGCSKFEIDLIPHVKSIWERAMSGEFGAIAEYVEPIQEPVVIPESL